MFSQNVATAGTQFSWSLNDERNRLNRARGTLLISKPELVGGNLRVEFPRSRGECPA